MDYPYGDRLFPPADPGIDDMSETTAQPPGAAHDDGNADKSRLLHTPAQAARLLSVRESWLRRMAGRREIPCTFVGKHLRFSQADLHSIVQRGSRSAHPASASRPQTRSPSSRHQQG